MFVWLQNAFQQCNKTSVACSHYKSSFSSSAYHLLVTLETEVWGGPRSVYKYHRTRWTYEGLSTHHFHWLQKDCGSSGHLKEQWRSRTVMKTDDIGASDKSSCSPCMQFMVGWSQTEQLFGSSLPKERTLSRVLLLSLSRGKRACHHRALLLKPGAFLPVLLTLESLVH